MIKIKNAMFYENILIINRTHRFKNPSVIIKTWYGIKIKSQGTFRFYTFDKVIKKTLLEDLKLNKLDNKRK